VFKIRAETRAKLYQSGELSLIEAVDDLQAVADFEGLVEQIGQDAVQTILADAMRAAERPVTPQQQPVTQPEDFEIAHSNVAQSTLDAAFYLFNLGDKKRLRAWMDLHTEPERAAIFSHLERPNGPKPR
jgi:hypothetical protein